MPDDVTVADLTEMLAAVMARPGAKRPLNSPEVRRELAEQVTKMWRDNLPDSVIDVQMDAEARYLTVRWTPSHA